jgi:hypothetical protein
MLYQRHPLKANLWQDVPCYYTVHVQYVMCERTFPATKEGRPAQSLNPSPLSADGQKSIG